MKTTRWLFSISVGLFLATSGRSDQKCPSHSPRTAMTDLHSDGTGGSPGFAYDDAVFGFDDIPACAPCDSGAHYCTADVTIQPNQSDPVVTYEYDPDTGVWSCSISVDKGSTFIQFCQC